MCHPAAIFAVQVGGALAQKHAADARQDAEFSIAQGNADRANEANTANLRQNISDINLQEIEKERQVNSQLEQNYVQQLESLGKVNVQGDASGFSGNSLDALYNEVNSSFAGQANLLRENRLITKQQADRERQAQFTAAKHGVRREKFLFADTSAQAGLKIASAAADLGVSKYKNEWPSDKGATV